MENLPWGQGTGGKFAFLELHSYPAGQGLQVVLEENELYPLSQTTGSEVVVGHLDPAGHKVQLVALPTEYVPAVQGSGNMLVNAH